MPDSFHYWLTASFHEDFARYDVVQVPPDIDARTPLLLANKHYTVFFSAHFPTNEVYHTLTRFLWQLQPDVMMQTMGPFLVPTFPQCRASAQ